MSLRHLPAALSDSVRCRPRRVDQDVASQARRFGQTADEVFRMGSVGVAACRVAAVVEALCGTEVSSAQVSRAARLLDEELEAWRTRPIVETPHLMLDARYEKVRHHGRGDRLRRARRDRRLALRGGGPLAGTPRPPKGRSMIGVRLVVSDDYAGLRAARRAGRPGCARRCRQFHLQRNIVSGVPQAAMPRGVARAIRSVSDVPDRETVERALVQAAEWRGKRARRLLRRPRRPCRRHSSPSTGPSRTAGRCTP